MVIPCCRWPGNPGCARSAREQARRAGRESCAVELAAARSRRIGTLASPYGAQCCRLRPPSGILQEVQEDVAALEPDDDGLKAWRARAPLAQPPPMDGGGNRPCPPASAVGCSVRRIRRGALPAVFSRCIPARPEADQEQRTIDIDGEVHPYLSLIVWSTVATPPGLPATVMPMGRSKAGLPIGVQIIGPLLEDRTPLAFAGLLEREFGGFVRPPELQL